MSSSSDLSLADTKKQKVVSLNAMALKLTKTIEDEEQALKGRSKQMEHKVPKQKGKVKNSDSLKSQISDNVTLEELIAKLKKFLPNAKVKSTSNSKNSLSLVDVKKNSNEGTQTKISKEEAPVSVIRGKLNKESINYNDAKSIESYLKPFNMNGQEALDYKFQIPNLTEPYIPLLSKQQNFYIPICPKVYSVKEIHAAKIIQAHFRGYTVRKITSNLLKLRTKRKYNNVRDKELCVPTLQDIPAVPHDHFKNYDNRIDIRNYVKPLIDITETGDINAFTESHYMKYLSTYKSVDLSTYKSVSECSINNVYDSKLLDAVKSSSKIKNIIKDSGKSSSVVDNLYLDHKNKSDMEKKGGVPLASSKNPVYSSINENTSSGDEIDLKNFCSNKGILRSFSLGDSEYETLEDVHQDHKYNEASSTSQIGNSFSHNKNSIQNDVPTNLGFFPFNSFLKSFEKEKEVNNVFPVTQQISPSHLRSKLNAELVFQDTIGSALNHLQDLQNIQEVSEVGHVYYFNNKDPRPKDKPKRKFDETVEVSESKFQSNIEKLEKNLHTRISKLEQEMKSQIGKIIDSATKADSINKNYGFDFKLSRSRSDKNGKENGLQSERSFELLKEDLKNPDQTVEQHLFTTSGNLFMSECDEYLNSTIDEIKLDCKNKNESSIAEMSNISKQNKSLHVVEDDININLVKSSDSHLNTPNVFIKKLSDENSTDDVHELFDECDLELRFHTDKGCCKESNDLSDASSCHLHSKNFLSPKENKSNHSNTVNNISLQENPSVTVANDTTSSSSIKTLLSEVSSSSSVQPNKHSLYNLISPASSSSEKHANRQKKTYEVHSQPIYKSFAALSESELHSSVKKVCTAQNNKSSLSTMPTESRYNGLQPSENTSFSESFDPDSGASDSSDIQVKPVKERENTEKKHFHKCSGVNSHSKDENFNSMGSHLELPKNAKGGALQSILNLLTSLQKEEEIRLNHQMTVFKLQEKYLIEEAKSKLVALSSEGGSNTRKKQRAILLQLREQRAHMRRLMETQNLTTQQRQSFLAHHYNLLCSTLNTGRIVSSRTHSPVNYSNLDMSSSEGLENLSSVSSLSKSLKKLGCSSVHAEEELNSKRHFEWGAGAVSRDDESWPGQALLKKGDAFKWMEEKKKKGKEHLKYVFLDNIDNKSDECDNVDVEISKNIMNRRAVLDNFQALQKEKESLHLSTLSMDDQIPGLENKHEVKLSNSNLIVSKFDHKLDQKTCTENCAEEQPLDVSNMKDDRSLFVQNDKFENTVKSDTEIIVQGNQNLKRTATDRKRRDTHNGFPFTFRYALSPRSTSLQYRRQSSESDDSFNLSQNDTTSDISDGEGRLVALREELALRKAEAEKLKEERRKIKQERILSQEQALRNQIAAYDSFIQRKKLEIEKETQELCNTVAVKPLIRKPFACSPKATQIEDCNVTESLPDDVLVDDSITSDNSSVAEQPYKVDSSHIDDDNNTESISNVKLINTDITNLVKISQKEHEISKSSHTEIVSSGPDKTEVMSSGPDKTEIVSSEPDKTEVMPSGPDKTEVVSSVPDKTTLMDEISILSSLSNNVTPDNNEEQNVEKIQVATNNIAVGKETLEKKYLVIKLNSKYEKESATDLRFDEIKENKIVDDEREKMNIYQRYKTLTAAIKSSEDIHESSAEEPQKGNIFVSEEISSKPISIDSNLKKANVIADNILESLVKESINCMKKVFKNKNESEVIPDNEIPKGVSPARSKIVAISEERKDLISTPSEILKGTEVAPNLIHEINLQNKTDETGLVEKSLVGFVEGNKECTKIAENVPVTIPHQSTTAEFYYGTDINETFSISSYEGEWLGGEFWKTNEKIKSQKELREEEELLNAEIARLEELQRFKELYPNLVIREVPDKPPPPYTPPKGEALPSSFEESSKLPEPQTPSNTISVPHRLSKADLRKIASDIVNVVPVKEDILFAVERNSDFLYCEWQKGKNPVFVDCFSVSRSGMSEAEEIDASEISESAFNILIFHLARQFVSDVYVLVNTVSPPFWVSHFHQHKKPRSIAKQLTEESVRNHVVKNVRDLFKMDPVTKKETAMMKWAMKKKEPVDQILVQELQMEELSWVQYHEEEAHVKAQLAQDIFSNLIDETICLFESILSKTLF